MEKRETYGVKFVVSGETFNEYKGTLQDQLEEKDKEIERLQNIMKEVREYIEKNLTKDDNGCGCWWYGFNYYEDAKQHLLDIIDKENNGKI